MMVKHTQTIRRFLTRNFLSVFDHFVGLALKGLGLYQQRGMWNVQKNLNKKFANLVLKWWILFLVKERHFAACTGLC